MSCCLGYYLGQSILRQKKTEPGTTKMVLLSNISLLISDGDTGDTKKLTVEGMNTFDESDIGKSYQLQIIIFADDKENANLSAGAPRRNNVVYTFTWGLLSSKKNYKKIAVTVAGEQNFSEMRQVSADVLNEDSGSIEIPSPDINTPTKTLFFQDEVYAQVTMLAKPPSAPWLTRPVSARSPTVVFNAGL